MIWLILALLATSVELIAVRRNLKHPQYFAKPAVMVFLFIWLYVSTGLQGNAVWFGLGIVFALLGDIILMNTSDRMFLLGLGAFVFTHIFYLIGFREQLVNPTSWSLILFFIIYINGLRLLRRIVTSMRSSGQKMLTVPVIVYSLLLALMLFAAMSTIFDPAWKTAAAFLVSVGAFLFYLSDLVLAWNRFVSPIHNGLFLNLVTYHLGQISLIAGVISQMMS